MNTIELETTDKTAMRIFRDAFPDTNFRSITVRAFRGPMSLNSYWCGGHRDYFAVVPIEGGKVASVPENGTPFTRPAGLELSELPAGFALAVHHYGRTARGTLYLPAANITPMLPAAGPAAPWIETAVLAVVCSLKSFARREQAARLGIGAGEYDATIEVLKGKRLLTASGGASPDGRNLDNRNREIARAGIGWNWGKLAMAGDRDSEEKRTAIRYAEMYAIQS